MKKYVGWIIAPPDVEDALRLLGVRGKIKYSALAGVYTDCEIDEAVHRVLKATLPSYIPRNFTAVDAEGKPLPDSEQDLWRDKTQPNIVKARLEAKKAFVQERQGNLKHADGKRLTKIKKFIAYVIVLSNIALVTYFLYLCLSSAVTLFVTGKADLNSPFLPIGVMLGALIVVGAIGGILWLFIHAFLWGVAVILSGDNYGKDN